MYHMTCCVITGIEDFFYLSLYLVLTVFYVAGYSVSAFRSWSVLGTGTVMESGSLIMLKMEVAREEILVVIHMLLVQMTLSIATFARLGK